MAVYSTTIEVVHDAIWLCQHGVYESHSVLAGQSFRQLCKPYNTLEEAIKENPDATVCVDQDLTPEPVHIPVNPPSWFDPADAGEVWSEDDY